MVYAAVSAAIAVLVLEHPATALVIFGMVACCASAHRPVPKVVRAGGTGDDTFVDSSHVGGGSRKTHFVDSRESDWSGRARDGDRGGTAAS